MSITYRVLLGLASFVEYSIKQGQNEEFTSCFCIDGLNNCITIKNQVSKLMCDAFGDPTFSEVHIMDDDKKVGTHSTRKYDAMRRRLLLYCVRVNPPCKRSSWKATCLIPGLQRMLFLILPSITVKSTLSYQARLYCGASWIQYSRWFVPQGYFCFKA